MSDGCAHEGSQDESEVAPSVLAENSVNVLPDGPAGPDGVSDADEVPVEVGSLAGEPGTSAGDGPVRAGCPADEAVD